MKKGKLLHLLRMALLVLFLFATGCAAAPRPSSTAPEADAGAAAAVSRSVAFLRTALAEDRYTLVCTASDGSSCPVNDTGHVFAGFFIATALDGMLGPDEKARLIARLDREERQGVWGYMPYAPVDADDTAFVLRTYRLLGRDVAPDALMRFYIKAAKGFTTFDSLGSAAIALAPSVAHNNGIHPEVNANIFTLLAGTSLAGLVNEALIAGTQTASGSWPAYFYPDPYYSTYMSLNALCTAGLLKTTRDRGLAFLSANQNPDGSWGSPGGVYETALALNALVACGIADKAVRNGAAWLRARQEADGSWRSPATIIWEFHYSDVPQVVWRAFDSNGIVTTALVVRALRSFSEKMQ